jgi:hypothetical protein
MLREVHQHLTEIKALQTIEGARTVESGWTDGLGGMRSVTIFAEFEYGSGGESVDLVIQTAIDGQTPIDIARATFDKQSRTVICNVTADRDCGWFDPKPLSPGDILCGVLGDRLRYRLKSTGIYENTALRVYFAPR